MYKPLILAVLFVAFIASANAAELTKKVAPTSVLYNNKMDTNHDGMVSIKEANAYGDKTASQSKRQKNIKINSIRKDSKEKSQKNNIRNERSTYIEPLENESEFHWSNSKKR